MKMAQEENVFWCKFSGGSGGCKSKKIKPKKVPQRGLGVAQLEKIIFEEKQHKELLQEPSNAISFLSFKEFRPNTSHFHNSLPPPSNTQMLQEGCSVSRLWDGECDISLHKQMILDHQRSSQPPPSSMVQRSRSNNYATPGKDEDNMVGMKRAFPFSLESSLPLSSVCNVRPGNASSSSRLEKLANNGYASVSEARNKCIRGSHLPHRMPNGVAGDVDGDGKILKADFLTLAPPSVASSSSKSKHNPRYI